MKFLAFLFVYIGACVGSKILVVFPVPGKSHGILGSSIVSILLDAGHEVTYISPFTPEISASNLTYVDISSVTAVLSGQKRLNLAALSKTPHPLHHTQQVGPMFARKLLEHPAVRALLQDPDVTFDLVLAEWFFTGLLAPLAEVYDCPLIWYRVSEVCWQSLRVMHEASSPTYSRDMHANAAPASPFSFADRFYQTWIQLYVTGWIYFVKYQVEIPAYEELYRRPLSLRGKALADFDSLAHNGSLMLANSHAPLGQRLPLPQNVQYIGGHHLEVTPSPLPQDLKKLFDESQNGVIFFSMGSMLKGKDLPESLKRPLLDMFSELKQTVVWKLEEEIVNLPKNVHVVEWAPQQSILNHSNTVLFITHGGVLSVLEATQYGVPIVGIPIFGDHFASVNLAVERGVAIRLDFSEDFPQKLYEAINTILGNHSYRENAKTASFVFRYRESSPQQALRYWVQYVIATKGAAHLRSPALQVAAPDRLYLDFLFFFVLMLWFLRRLIKLIMVHIDSPDDSNKKND